MNNQPCGKCSHFDPIMKNIGRGRQAPSNSAWCGKRSLYPYKENEGQVFPDDAKRVDSLHDAAKPVIVHPTQVVPTCPYFQAATNGKVR